MYSVPRTVYGLQYSVPMHCVSVVEMLVCCDNTSSVLCCLAVQLQVFRLGVTTKKQTVVVREHGGLQARWSGSRRLAARFSCAFVWFGQLCRMKTQHLEEIAVI